MAKKITLLFNRDRCKGCGICMAFCSSQLLRAGEDLNVLGYHAVEMTEMERCTGCGSCALTCPDLVISVQKEESA